MEGNCRIQSGSKTLPSPSIELFKLSQTLLPFVVQIQSSFDVFAIKSNFSCLKQSVVTIQSCLRSFQSHQCFFLISDSKFKALRRFRVLRERRKKSAQACRVIQSAFRIIDQVQETQLCLLIVNFNLLRLSTEQLEACLVIQSALRTATQAEAFLLSSLSRNFVKLKRLDSFHFSPVILPSEAILEQCRESIDHLEKSRTIQWADESNLCRVREFRIQDIVSRVPIDFVEESPLESILKKTKPSRVRLFLSLLPTEPDIRFLEPFSQPLLLT